MKFMITGKPKAGIAIPPEQAVQLGQAQHQFVKAQLESGALDAFYNVVPTGGVAIANADSAEAVMEAIVRYPGSALMEWDVKMLYTLEEGYRIFQIRLSQARNG
ncbi:MAG: hypothetical protein ACOY93_07910 [Bacillota bacterium]